MFELIVNSCFIERAGSQEEDRIKKVSSQSVVTRKMDNDSYNRDGKIPKFDGGIQNFPTWWEKVSAYATIARIKSILKEERDFYLPEKEVSEIDETDEKAKLARTLSCQ
jgi:hypothetical protein